MLSSSLVFKSAHRPILARHQNAFGLLEVILVFAIVIGAAAVIFSVFQSAKPSADAANEVEHITTMAANIKSDFGLDHDYAGLNNITVRQAKAVPASMDQPTTPTGIQSQWGPVNVVSLPNAGPVASGLSSFDINYANIPTEACNKLVIGLSGFMDDIRVGPVPYSVNDLSATVFTAGKLDPNKVIANCSSASVVTVDFIGH